MIAKKKGKPKPKRCAIYTRKSTDEGLDAEFSTLDNQRQAAENYIASQVGEGWVALPEKYDDGGFSGGNMERPALQRLLEDVKAGKVDCIVVYKVDRLSRSILDFARIIDTLDQSNCSFVAVTQNFSTADSLGRLTLNILLSFAQFEREIIAERTRDKMSAARKQGRWTGGMPVLGYDIDPGGGKLIVNNEEVDLVRNIFTLYLEQESLLAVVKVLREMNIHNKTWVTKKGVVHQGKPFSKTTLQNLLRNVLYIGKVRHHGDVYEGKQERIVDPAVWDKVQALLKHNRHKGRGRVSSKHGGILKGLLSCASCNAAMIHSHTYKKKKGKTYRYYVCGNAQKNGWDQCPGPSVPAQEMESYVVNQIKAIGRDASLAEKTFEAATREVRSQIQELENEENKLKKELKRKIEELDALSGSHRRTPKSLAEAQKRITETEQRITAIRERILALSRQLVDKVDVAHALSTFDPVWENLTPHEQAQALRILIEQVQYKAKDGAVAITFRDTGIRDLIEFCESEVEQENEPKQEELYVQG